MRVERAPEIGPDVYGAAACSPATTLEHEGMSLSAQRWLARASRQEGAIANRLLESADEEALDDALDELVDNGDVLKTARARWRAVREVQIAHGRAPLPDAVPMVGELDRGRLVALLGDEAAELVEAAFGLTLQLAHARREIMASTGQDDAGPDAHTDHDAWEPEWHPERILDLAPAWRTAVFRSLRGVPAGLATMTVIHDGLHVQEWLAKALAQRWFDGEEAAARVLCAVLGLDDVPDPLPKEVRARPEDPELIAAFDQSPQR